MLLLTRIRKSHGNMNGIETMIATGTVIMRKTAAETTTEITTGIMVATAIGTTEIMTGGMRTTITSGSEPARAAGTLHILP